VVEKALKKLEEISRRSISEATQSILVLHWMILKLKMKKVICFL